MGKTYSPEYKVEFCKRIVGGGEKVSAVCAETGVLENKAYGWVARYNENREKPFCGSGHTKAEDVELKKLQKGLKEAREEIEILKKAAA
jgi:transposase-like protein